MMNGKGDLPAKLAAYRSRAKLELSKRYKGYLLEALLYSIHPFVSKTEPVGKFFILSFPRTGSNHLASLLDSHPMIHCENELLISRLAQPMRYIQLHASRSKKKVFGFKLQAHHLDLQCIADPGGFIRELFDTGYQIITLSRRNLFRSALSLLYARDSGRFHYQQGGPGIAYPKIHIDPAELLERIGWMEAQRERIRQWTRDLPRLELVYEADLLDSQSQQATVRCVLDFLEVPYHDLSSKFVRMKSDDLSAFVKNVDEVIAAVSASPYAHYLVE